MLEDDVIAAAGPGLEVVVQEKQQGTGNAVLQAREALRGKCDVVAILYADTALLRLETLQQMVAAAEDAALVLRGGLRLRRRLPRAVAVLAAVELPSSQLS